MFLLNQILTDDKPLSRFMFQDDLCSWFDPGDFAEKSFYPDNMDIHSHCRLQKSTPIGDPDQIGVSFGYARPVSGAFYLAAFFLTFYNFINLCLKYTVVL